MAQLGIVVWDRSADMQDYQQLYCTYPVNAATTQLPYLRPVDVSVIHFENLSTLCKANSDDPGSVLTPKLPKTVSEGICLKVQQEPLHDLRTIP